MTTAKKPAQKPDNSTAPQLRYTSRGRYGTIQYMSQETSFDVGYEFAGGNAVAIIYIPSPQRWEAQTHTSLSQRADILQFIGEQVIKDRLRGDGYFLVDDIWLTLYSGRNPNV